MSEQIACPEIDLLREIHNGLGVDPTQQVREMLDAGRFRAAGETEVRGTAARLLIAEEPAVDGGLRRTEYLVDADTYAPLEIRTLDIGGSTDPTTTTAASSPRGNPSAASGDPVLISRVVIDRYELLPLDNHTRRLFQVPQNPDAGSAAHPPNPWGSRAARGERRSRSAYPPRELRGSVFVASITRQAGTSAVACEGAARRTAIPSR